jgi:hypothetical protein
MPLCSPPKVEEAECVVDVLLGDRGNWGGGSRRHELAEVAANADEFSPAADERFVEWDLQIVAHAVSCSHADRASAADAFRS